MTIDFEELQKALRQQNAYLDIDGDGWAILQRGVKDVGGVISSGITEIELTNWLAGQIAKERIRSRKRNR